MNERQRQGKADRVETQGGIGADAEDDRTVGDESAGRAGASSDAPPAGRPNRDPISGERGSHPVGTGSGAAGGAAAGAVIGGVVGGPVGMAVGGAVGAVAGGLAGNRVAEAVNPTEEDRFWRENYRTRPYTDAERDYEHYRPAYQFGWEARARHADRSWEEVESDLALDWPRQCGDSRLAWTDAHPAARDAWQRIDEWHARRRSETDDRAAGDDRAARDDAAGEEADQSPRE
jgi:hypothetical protein